MSTPGFLGGKPISGEWLAYFLFSPRVVGLRIEQLSVASRQIGKTEQREWANDVFGWSFVMCFAMTAPLEPCEAMVFARTARVAIASITDKKWSHCVCLLFVADSCSEKPVRTIFPSMVIPSSPKMPDK